MCGARQWRLALLYGWAGEFRIGGGDDGGRGPLADGDVVRVTVGAERIEGDDDLRPDAGSSLTFYYLLSYDFPSHTHHSKNRVE